MKKIGMFVGSVAALTAGLAFALTADAHSERHVSRCALGKEAAGCKLNGTAYGELGSRVLVGLPSSVSPKGTRTELSVPASFACPGGGEASLLVGTKAAARIGGSLSFSGKAKVQGFTTSGATNVKSASIAAKLKITSAKKASMSGKVELVLDDGSKCTKKLPTKLLRILGG